MNKLIKEVLREEEGDLSAAGGGGIGGGIASSEASASEAPASEAPASEAPASEAPASEAPSYDFESEDLYKTFVQTLPEDQREREFFKNTKSLKSLAEQAINAQSALGRKRLQAPQEDWSDAEWDDFYAHIKPETAEAYKGNESVSVFLDDQESKEFTFDENISSDLKDVAFKLNLPEREYSALQQIWAEHSVKAEAQLNQQINESVQSQNNALQQEWGMDYASNHKSANEAFEVISKQIPELNELVEWSPIVANHPAVMKLFNLIAPSVKDLGLPNTGVGGSTFSDESVASLKSQISDLDTKYRDLIMVDQDGLAKMNPADKAKRERILKQRTELYQKTYSE